MPDAQVKGYLDQLADIRTQTLAELVDLERHELKYAARHPRYYTVQRTLALLGNHVREHTTQLAAAREAILDPQSMSQRILARAEQAYGDLQAALVGLTDEQLDRVPEPGEWTIRQTLEHLVKAQDAIAGRIREARQRAEISERD